VVECGSGASTILIARLLAERETGAVQALEHDAAWAARVRARIAAEGLGARARVVHAPLRPDPIGAPGCEWYDRAALAELPGAGIDLLLVDGPPASPGSGLERSRYPALPVLADRLAPEAKVILDDVARKGEIWVRDRWQRELGARFERSPGERLAIGVCSRLGD
jgi:predicted O-methyltransferase YrrM